MLFFPCGTEIAQRLPYVHVIDTVLRNNDEPIAERLRRVDRFDLDQPLGRNVFSGAPL